jgi:hypothetical protein
MLFADSSLALPSQTAQFQRGLFCNFLPPENVFALIFPPYPDFDVSGLSWSRQHVLPARLGVSKKLNHFFWRKQAVMKVSHNISIHIEEGFLQIRGQIPVANAGSEIESFIRELKFQLFGDAEAKNGQSNDRPAHVVPKDLNEKDAAKYIGRTVSFLRSCRYGGKNKEQRRGPKYARDSQRCIRYPVKELDRWLENRELYDACCEEGSCLAMGKAEKHMPSVNKVKEEA